MVDESSSYHTKDDTRYLYPGKYGSEGSHPFSALCKKRCDGDFNRGLTVQRVMLGCTGLGWGYFRIYAHLNGTVAGYSWSTSKYSTFYAPAARDLVIGRLNTTAPVRARAMPLSPGTSVD